MRTRIMQPVVRTVALFVGLVPVAIPAAAQDWVAEFTPDDGMAYDRFGFALAADQGRVLASSFAAEPAPQLQDVGAAYVFEQGATGWSQIARLDPSDPVHHAQFGRSVGLAGDFAIVGAPHAEEQGSETGVVYLFERGGGWVESQRLLATPWTLCGEFGRAVAIDGERLVVGAPGADGSGPGDGAAFVFRRGVQGWVQVAVLHGEPNPGPQRFGSSVAIRGETVVVGAPRAFGSAKESGRVYVFEESGGSWAVCQRLEDPDGGAHDAFGFAVSLGVDELAVGAPQADVGALDSGCVQMFDRSPSAWIAGAVLVPPQPRPQQAFGFAVELAGTLLFTSSPLASADAPGSGDAWLFGRSGANWLELPSPRRPKLTTASGYGSAVAIGPGYAAFGTFGDSNVNPQNPGQGSVSIVALDSVPQHAAYCFGTSCPCGNLADEGGCRNSTGAGGRLSATGSLSVRRADLRLIADRLPRGRVALLVLGRSPTWSLAGDGLLCVGGGARGVHVVGGPRWTGRAGLVEYSGVPLGDDVANAGEARYLQLLYRDPAGPCSQQFNASNALALSLVP